jgi:hypothetical protein
MDSWCTMTIVLKPEQEKIVRDAIHDGLIESVDEFIDLAIGALPHAGVPDVRTDAVRRMQEFGEKHKLSFGAAISRKVLHEGHRFDGSIRS